jgi:hypothetical protein
MARVCVQDWGTTALMRASMNGYEDCVRLLLGTDAIEVNAKDVSLEPSLSQHNALAPLT